MSDDEPYPVGENSWYRSKPTRLSFSFNIDELDVIEMSLAFYVQSATCVGVRQKIARSRKHWGV